MYWLRCGTEWLKAALLLALTVLVCAAIVLLFQISAAVQHADARMNETFGRLDETIAQFAETAKLGGKLVNDARLSADNLNKAAIDERFYFERQLPGLMDQAQGILGNLQTATGDLGPLLAETTARTHALAPLETNAAALVADADVTVRDPHIEASLNNLDVSTSELAVTSRESSATMASVQAMAKDGQDEVHKLTHPKPLDEIADWTLKVVHAIGGFF